MSLQCDLTVLPQGVPWARGFVAGDGVAHLASNLANANSFAPPLPCPRAFVHARARAHTPTNAVRRDWRGSLGEDEAAAVETSKLAVLNSTLALARTPGGRGAAAVVANASLLREV
jgi:hypothetical protein